MEYHCKFAKSSIDTPIDTLLIAHLYKILSLLINIYIGIAKQFPM